MAETPIVGPTANSLEAREQDPEGFKNQRLQAYMDWQNTLQTRVDSGLITAEDRNRKIARAIFARDLLIIREKGHQRRDPLTGLLDRGSFDAKLEKMIAAGKPFGLLIVDIDHFKKVNDTFGHLAGDAVLVQLGLDLSSNVRQVQMEGENTSGRQNQDRQPDIVTRYGGEEIAILLPGVNDDETLFQRADNLRSSVAQKPFSVRIKGENHSIPISVSIGGARFTGQEKDSLIQEADERMYRAKEMGRNAAIVSI